MNEIPSVEEYVEVVKGMSFKQLRAAVRRAKELEEAVLVACDRRLELLLPGYARRP